MNYIIKILTFWIPIKSWRKKCRNSLLKFNWQYLSILYHLRCGSSVAVLSCDGMGDYIYLFGYMDEFKKVNKIKKLIFLARSNHQKFLAEKVLAFDKIMIVKPNFISLINSSIKYDSEKFLIGNFFQSQIYENISDKNCLAIDGLKFLLNIDKEAKLNLDIFKNYDTSKIIEIEKKISCFPKGKTVLISTHSVSLPTETEYKFWLNIADFLKKEGYRVVFNSLETDFYGYETIYPPKEDLSLYTDYFGYFISLRSGISDLIAVSSSAKNIIIYPTNLNEEVLKKTIITAYGDFNIDVPQFIFEKWSLKKISSLFEVFEVFDSKLDLNAMLDFMRK